MIFAQDGAGLLEGGSAIGAPSPAARARARDAGIARFKADARVLSLCPAQRTFYTTFTSVCLSYTSRNVAPHPLDSVCVTARARNGSNSKEDGSWPVTLSLSLSDARA